MPQPAPEDDVALILLHSADWHLGLEFPAFDEVDRVKLTRARLETIDRLFVEAEGNAVHAVLCAGDLFDEPAPAETWWKGLLELLKRRANPARPIVLLPGNHDPLTEESVYAARHAFRQQLPPGVHVVDKPDFTLDLGPEAVLFAAPCLSRAGEADPTQNFPPRAPGDERIRIGMVHGQTIDIPGYETNFPINPAAAAERGLDYLALGDTHAFRQLSPGNVVYPGAPEQTKFGEQDTGHAALVYFRRARSAPIIKKLSVGRWKWRDETCRDVQALRRLREADLATTVLRLHLDMPVSLTELDEVETLLCELKGTLAAQGRVGVMQVDRTRLVQTLPSIEEFPTNLPPVLHTALEKLRCHDDQELAKRAMYHLYQMVKRCG